MPKKPITWVGSLIILGAGVFCFSGLFQYRAKLASASTQVPWVTLAAFLSLVVMIGAISLWYYFNEKR